MPQKRIPIVCTLAPTDTTDQLSQWRELRQQVISCEPIAGGMAMTFAIELASTVEDLAAQEASCCAFMTLDVNRTEEIVRLEITSDDPAARPVIELLAGQPIP